MMRGDRRLDCRIRLGCQRVNHVGLSRCLVCRGPGRSATGPFNAHFVRDIGVAYLLSGATLVWFAIDPAARPAAMTGAAFLAIHAAVHLWDAAAGREHVHQLLVDLPPVFLPPVLAIWIVWPPSRPRAQSQTRET